MEPLKTTIYVLTDGSYSDYHIIGCYLNKELAQEVAAKFKCDIEEWEADEKGRDGRYSYIVHTYTDETETHVYLLLQDYKESDKHIGHYIHSPNRSQFWCEVLAEDEQHAIKIASDKIAQYRVENNL